MIECTLLLDLVHEGKVQLVAEHQQVSLSLSISRAISADCNLWCTWPPVSRHFSRVMRPMRWFSGRKPSCTHAVLGVLGGYGFCSHSKTPVRNPQVHFGCKQ